MRQDCTSVMRAPGHWARDRVKLYTFSNHLKKELFNGIRFLHQSVQTNVLVREDVSMELVDASMDGRETAVIKVPLT